MGKALLYLAILLLSLGIAVALLQVHSDGPQGVTPSGLAKEPASATEPAGNGEAALGVADDDALGGAQTATPPNQHRALENTLSVAACPEGMAFIDRPCSTSAGQPAECNDPAGKHPFCIDRYEYPNQNGVLPAAMVHYAEAERACKSEGKRLCHEGEWTRACQEGRGDDSTGEPAASAEHCNLGPAVDFSNPTDPTLVAEAVLLVDKRVASGQMAECVSSAGVADLIGNVQEWVRSAHPGYEAALKGGHFAGERGACLEQSNVRHHLLRRPYNGFRCCSEPLVAVRRSAAQVR